MHGALRKRPVSPEMMLLAPFQIPSLERRAFSPAGVHRNPSTQNAEAGIHKFKVSLAYRVIPFLKGRKEEREAGTQHTKQGWRDGLVRKILEDCGLNPRTHVKNPCVVVHICDPSMGKQNQDSEGSLAILLSLLGKTLFQKDGGSTCGTIPEDVL